MKLDINGIECELSPEMQAQLLGVIWQDMERRYTGLNGGLKAGLKLASRKILADMESQARKSAGEEAALKIRPPKRTDPNLHLGRVMFGLGNEALKNVTCKIDLVEDARTGEYRVTDLAVIQNQGQIGGPVADSGYDGIREDHLLEAAGGVYVEAVPERALLHTG
jgi:hypothetical protein